VFGGVLERHPGLDVCVSHGGGTAAFLSGRFARAVAKRAWASKALRDNGFEHYYRRIWFDTHVHDDRSLQLLVDHAGPDRLVYGTNFAGWDSGGDHGPGALVDTLTANAERLLRI
jgi:aminocarboxymuconate-semialdehyde decarboxylase